MTNRLNVRFLDPTDGNPGDVPTISPDGLTIQWGAAGAGTLGDLTDVDLTTTPATDGQVIALDDASGLWVPRTLSAAGTAGTASISAAATSVSIPHGITGDTPTVQDFQITPTNALGNATKFWVAAVDATDLTIAVDQTPGTGNTADFTWRFLRLDAAAAPSAQLLASWDFETFGTPGLPNGGSGYTQEAAAAKAGAYGYRYTGGAAHSARFSTAAYSPADGFFLEGWVRIAAGAGSPALAGLLFGSPGTGFNGYSATIDNRNGSGGTASFQIRKNQTATLASDASPVIATDAWYRITVQWVGALITAKLYDATGTLLGSVAVSDSTYTTGRVGVHGYGLNSHFDSLALYSAEPA